MEPTAVWVTYHTRSESHSSLLAIVLVKQTIILYYATILISLLDLMDMCKLHCSDKKTGNYYQLKEKVLDGTPCSPDSYDICVNGKCLVSRVPLLTDSLLLTAYCLLWANRAPAVTEFLAVTSLWTSAASAVAIIPPVVKYRKDCHRERASMATTQWPKFP